MNHKKAKWFTYTVLVGLIPVASRFFIWLVTNGNTDLVNASDFIALGLVLHVSNINELEHVSKRSLLSWKTAQNGISIAFIAFYSSFFCLTLLAEKVVIIDTFNVLMITAGMAVVSLFLSYSIYHRIT